MVQNLGFPSVNGFDTTIEIGLDIFAKKKKETKKMVVPEDRARIRNHAGVTGEDPFQEEAKGQLLLPGG